MVGRRSISIVCHLSERYTLKADQVNPNTFSQAQDARQTLALPGRAGKSRSGVASAVGAIPSHLPEHKFGIKFHAVFFQ